ncbi:MAG: hypothetical protein IMF09_02205 [Proteobacteria bacterium]|nr:hypothetical protein [Pseudomonadota bacterium]
MKFIPPFMHFMFAVLTTYLLASMVGTQLVLADILSFGLRVSLRDRLLATVHDLVGLMPALFLLITGAFLVAFVVAALCRRFLGGKQDWWYLAAGFTSLPAALMLIKYFMGATLFAAARTSFGMLLIALCGLAGGWVYTRLSQNRGV